MSDRPKRSRTPPPANVEATAPLMRGLNAETPAGADVHQKMTLGLPGDSEQPSLVGQTFGDFELTLELGRGGMGVVYKAWQKCLERPVALKLLLSEHTRNSVLLSRFLAEARAAASLNHPNIVSVYQVGECYAGPYFVMDFIDGPTVEVFVGRTLPVPWIVSLLVPVAEAVQHAHEKGIIHRDLKPGNIMLRQSKRPVVMDFGLAKVMGKSASTTLPGAVIGTPAYMAPEQAGEEPHKIGPCSDVYSLGAILYTLLTGKVPFDEGTALQTILRVITPEPPPTVRSLRPEVPARLEHICMKCLEKDPKKRYPTAQALADRLKRFRAALAAGTAAASVRVTVPLVLLIGRGGQQVRLFNPETVIGRGAECDLVVKVSAVSKRHCIIRIEADQVVVEDLGSSNGTFVNGEKKQLARLMDGDKLDIAGQVFEVRLGPGTK
jgi:hypothetical protein